MFGLVVMVITFFGENKGGMWFNKYTGIIQDNGRILDLNRSEKIPHCWSLCL